MFPARARHVPGTCPLVELFRSPSNTVVRVFAAALSLARGVLWREPMNGFSLIESGAEAQPSSLPYTPNFAHVLLERAAQQGGQRAYTFLEDGETRERCISYGELELRARSIGARLRDTAEVGARALLLYPAGLDFIEAFFGCLFAGLVPVPLYPPRPNQHAERVRSVAEDAGASVVLGQAETLTKLRLGGTDALPRLRSLATTEIESVGAAAVAGSDPVPLPADAIAFLQYTSGSTGQPKGVMVSHANLLANVVTIAGAAKPSARSLMVSWLPMFHDMGLVGGLLYPLFMGFPALLMSPSHFLQRPLRWLRAISRYQASESPAPNFAYELCIKAAEGADLSGLDLSRWQMAWNGGEPVRADTLERFSATFARAGFQHATHYPCFGMAEGTLLMTGSERGAGPSVLEVDATALEQGRAEPAGKAPRRRLVASGKPLAGDLAIVNPDTCRRVAAGELGELWFSGRNVARGYWNRPDASAETFGARLLGDPALEDPARRYLRTGDLGFQGVGGELFVTGRLKDMLIIRGRNLYPQDVEAAIEGCISAVRPNTCAVFGLDVAGEEVVGAVLEADRSLVRALAAARERLATDDAHAVASLLAQMTEAVAEQFAVALHTVAFVKPGTFPRTSSGKLRRAFCRTSLERGELATLYLWTTAATPYPAVSPAQPERESSTACEEPAPSPHAKRLITWFREYAERRLNSVLMEERRSVPPHVVLDFGRQGCFGMNVPRRFGGLEMSCRDHLRVTSQVAAVDLTLALLLGIHSGLGVRPILEHGCEELKQRLLPDLATGRQLAAFALTEAGAGSDPSAIQTRAVRAPGGWRVTGEKWWSGLAAWAGVITVICQAVDEQGTAIGPIALAVDADTRGLSFGPEAPTMGSRAIVQNSVRLLDAFVPGACVLGKPGSGMSVAQGAMMFARLGVAAIAVGALRRCAQLMLRYAGRRTIGGRLLAESPLTRTRVVSVLCASATHEALVARLASVLDAGESLPVEAYLACKICVPESLGEATDQLMQLLGGRGYLDSCPASQLYRDGRLLRIFEGPTEPLALHLGALVLSRDDFAELLSGPFAAPDLARELTASLAEIDQGAPTSLLSRSDCSELVRYHAGLIATAALVRAAARTAAPELEPTLARAAADWARQSYEEGLTRARRATEAGAQPLSWALLEPAATQLQASIGDVEQQLPGLDTQLDELLRRDPPARPAWVSPPEPLRPPDLPPTSALPSTEQRISAAVLHWMRQELKRPIERIDPDAPFSALGIDSLAAASLSAVLERVTGCSLRPELLYDLRSIRQLASQVDKGLLGSRGSAERGPPLAQPEPIPAQLEPAASAPANPTPREHGAPVAPEGRSALLERYAGRNERVRAMKQAGNYFYETPLSAQEGAWVVADGQRLLMMGSYSYLGLVNHPQVNQAAYQAIERFGCGHHGTRLLSGTLELHRQVERSFADFLLADDALIFSSGFGANAATIAALVSPGDVVIGDAWNHASIVDGCQLSGADFVTYPHANLSELEARLRAARGRHTLVVVDSVFSMDGDIVDLPAVLGLCRRYGALSMVDEAHSLGVLGGRGRGIQEHFGLPPDAIDVKMATLSKALPSCGGVVAGRQELIDFLRHNARGYVFSGAVPAASLAAAEAGLRVLGAEPERVQRLWHNLRRYGAGVKALGFDTLRSCTPIVPLLCQDEAQTMEMTRRCREQGVYVAPVIFPAVPVNSPRLRTCVTAAHNDSDIDLALAALSRAGRAVGLLR